MVSTEGRNEQRTPTDHTTATQHDAYHFVGTYLRSEVNHFIAAKVVRNGNWVFDNPLPGLTIVDAFLSFVGDRNNARWETNKIAIATDVAVLRRHKGG